jgi:hypothetical protein
MGTHSSTDEAYLKQDHIISSMGRCKHSKSSDTGLFLKPENVYIQPNSTRPIPMHRAMCLLIRITRVEQHQRRGERGLKNKSEDGRVHRLPHSLLAVFTNGHPYACPWYRNRKGRREKKTIPIF